MDAFLPARLSRRNVLAMVALTLTLPRAAIAGRVASRFDPGAPENLLNTFMRMRCALDDRLVIGYLQGRYYGVLEDALTPLYGVMSATFARHRPDGAGGFEIVSGEVAFFTDLETDQVLQTWHNPYTQETVTVQQPAMPAGRSILGMDLSLRVVGARPGMSLTHRVSPVSGAGDDFWLIEESLSELQLPGSAKPFHYGEIVTLRSKKSDLMKQEARRVPCLTSYESVVSWRPWLNMGDRTGHLTAVGSGAYGVAMEQLPAAMLQALANRRPELLKSPGSAIAALWAER